MYKEKLAVIIPTKDRPGDIERLLRDISCQETKPLQVVVVDGGDTPVEDIPKKFPGLNVDYKRCVPASLTAQRNAGIKAVTDEATLIAFLDDDVTLQIDSFKNMMRFWENASADTGGAGFNLTNIPYKRSSLIDKIFLVNPDEPGAILRSGFQSKSRFVDKTVAVEWLVGCATVWRRRVFDEFDFDEWFSGYAHCEDVDFSYRVGRKYKMFIVADAKAEHLSRHIYKLEDLDSSILWGRMQVANRLYLAKKNPEFSVMLSYWACLGLFLNNAIEGIFRRNQRYMLRAKGNIEGFFKK